MVFLKKMDRYFGLFLSAGVLFGFLFPNFFLNFEAYVIYILMAIIGLLFMKVDVVDIVTHVQKPLLLVYIAAFNLIAIPIIAFFLFTLPFFNHVDPALLTGIILLAALPSGVSSAVFTDIMNGRTSLNLTIVIMSNLMSAVTMPMVFKFLFSSTIAIADIDYSYLFISIFGIIFVPFIIAKLIKRLIFPIAQKCLPKTPNLESENYYNFLILTLLSFMMMISISLGAEQIKSDFSSLIITLIILYGVFFLFQVLSYFSVYWLQKGEKLAVSNASMIMNNILGIVIAIAFFDQKVLNIIILSFIPWSTMIILKHWYRHLLP